MHPCFRLFLFFKGCFFRVNDSWSCPVKVSITWNRICSVYEIEYSLLPFTFRLVKDRIQNNVTRRKRHQVNKRRLTAIFSFDGHNICLKVTLWTFIAVFSAAAFAYFKSSYYEDVEWEWWGPFR